MLGIKAGMEQKDCCSGIYKAGFDGCNTPRAVLSFLVRRPMKLCIMAGMVQKPLFPTSLLYLAVTLLCLVLPLEYRTVEFPGDDSRNGFRVQHS